MATLNEDFLKLVYARVQALPNGTVVSIGSDANIPKNELLEHIKNGDEIGQKMYQVEKAFFDALKSGSIYDSIT